MTVGLFFGIALTIWFGASFRLEVWQVFAQIYGLFAVAGLVFGFLYKGDAG